MRRAIVAVTLCICLHNELRELQLKTVDLPIFLKQIDERIPGFMDDLQPLMKTTEQILAVPAGTDLAKAVQAQVAVAAEHYGGILAASANGFGLPSEAAARNLFDLVVGTMYLMKNPQSLVDFIEFGQLTVYRLMKSLSPESTEHQQAQARDLAKYDAEMKRLEEKFDRRNFWHGRQILQIAQTVGMEQLYKIGYKTASGIIHGSSYPILSRNEKLEWVVVFQKHRWDGYVKESPIFGYLMLGIFYREVFRFFQIADTTNLNELEGVCARLADG
jgi:hypothetical protein